MLAVQKLVKEAEPTLHVVLLHSDVIGNEDEEDVYIRDAAGRRTLVLSTVTGAWTITLPKLKYIAGENF